VDGIILNLQTKFLIDHPNGTGQKNPNTIHKIKVTT